MNKEGEQEKKRKKYVKIGMNKEERTEKKN